MLGCNAQPQVMFLSCGTHILASQGQAAVASWSSDTLCIVFLKDNMCSFSFHTYASYCSAVLFIVLGHLWEVLFVLGGLHPVMITGAIPSLVQILQLELIFSPPSIIFLAVVSPKGGHTFVS